MERLILNAQQVDQLVRANAYDVNPAKRFMARCIDGRYETEKDLPALTIAGADAGQLAVIFAAANTVGLEVDREKAYKALTSVIGGERNLRVHTDEHNPSLDEVVMAGCGHKNHMRTDPDGFDITWEDVEFIKNKVIKAKEKGAKEIVLKGSHQEGGVLFIKGNKGIYPRHEFETESGKVLGQVFISHQTLVNERHKALAAKLIENGAFPNLKESDEDYLYTMLSEASEGHLFEIAGRLAKGLPIFEVSFKEDGDFTLKDLGQVE